MFECVNKLGGRGGGGACITGLNDSRQCYELCVDLAVCDVVLVTEY